ncbi:hypothetical protein BGZ65_011397 [Modicella reniformis]|uniref:Proline-rich protein PRCC n=1 Tax=Modicella reniformis TaxID=1440133 RepID=A0A9P6SP21_9FUNG|nr:hypothetical protein BGZ65_011397 [Modicella reniformis]
MNALAAYGSDSDDSGPESTPVSTSTRASTSTPMKTGVTAGGSKINSLSSMLPPPKSSGGSSSTTTTSTTTVSAPVQPKTSKYYTLPTMETDSDSDEEESVFRKKAKLVAEEAAKSAGSGGVGTLFAMLPAPKKNSSAAAKPGFMPRTLKKPVATVKKPVKNTLTTGQEDNAEDEDDEDYDSEASVSFFPLGAAATPSLSSSDGKTASSTYIPLYFDKKPLTTEERQAQNREEIDVSMTNEQYAYSSNEQYSYSEQYAYPTNDQYDYQSNDQYANPTNDTYAYGTDGYTQSKQGAHARGQRANAIELDDVGLQKLGMRKARDIPINVIDVSAKEQMSQAQHVRAAASGSNAPSKPVDPTSIQHLKPTAALKRKHNIISLAYQAKANEAQLNATWAASRKTKAETQAKYGF